MALDDVNSPFDRERFLEEIKRRAEEAELARIEAEELKWNAQFAGESLPSIVETTTDIEEELSAHLLKQLRDSLTSNDKQRASAAYDEMILLNPQHPELNALEDRLRTLHQSQEKTTRPQDDEPQQDEPQRDEPQRGEPRRGEVEHSGSEQFDEWTFSRPEAPPAESNPSLLFDSNDDLRHRRHSCDLEPTADDRRRSDYSSDEAPPRSQDRERDDQTNGTLDGVKAKPQEDEPNKNAASVPADRTPLKKPGEETRKGGWVRWKTLALPLVALFCLAAAYTAYKFVQEKFFPTRIRLLVLPARTSTAEMHITDGLTEQLISGFAHIPSMEVFAPKTILSLRGADWMKSVQMLGADFVLQLKFEHHGDQIAVNVSLTEAGSGNHEHAFTLPADKLAGICGAIVPHVASALGIEVESPEIHHPANAKAFIAYLLGRYALLHPDGASLDSAASAFQRSCAADPSFPDAEAALGWTRILQYEASPESSQQKLAEAKNHLSRAMNLGARSSEVHRLWGAIAYHTHDVAKAVEHYSRAIALAPSDAESQQRASLAFLRALNSEEAQQTASAAAVVDPFNPEARSLYGMLLMLRGDNANAVKQFVAAQRHNPAARVSDEHLAALVAVNDHEGALDILRDRAVKQPDDYIVLHDLGRMLQLAGKPKAQWEEALLKARKFIHTILKNDSSDGRAHAYLGLVSTRLGAFAEGISSAHRALAKTGSDVGTRYLVARIYALQRDKLSEGFVQLSSAAHQRLIVSALLDLDLQNLRNDPDFLRKIVE